MYGQRESRPVSVVISLSARYDKMSDATLNSKALQVAARERLRDSVMQAEKIIAMHGGNVAMLVLGANAEPGQAFKPLTGYAIKTTRDAAFVPGHYDTQNLFRGRCVLPLVPGAFLDQCGNAPEMDKMCKTLNDNAVLSMYYKAYAAALEDNQERSDMVSLRPSESSPGWACLLLDESTGSHFVAVEAHLLPHEDALGEDISTYLAREGAGITVSDAFFNQHPVGRTNVEYMRAQKHFREILCRHMRRKLVKHFFGEEIGRALASDDKDAAAHFHTNIANLSPDGESFIYYSQMSEATMDYGALIGAGPFKRCIWVNYNGGGGDSIVKANMLRAVPFDMPTSIGVSGAVVKILDYRAKQEAGSNAAEDDENFAAVIRSEDGYTHASHAIVKSRDPTGSSENGPLGMTRRTRSVVGDLIWKHYKHHTGQEIATVSPYEYIDYVRGVEFEGTKGALEMFGVDMVSGMSSNIALSPLFCASDPQSIMTTVALAEAMAEVTHSKHCT